MTKTTDLDNCLNDIKLFFDALNHQNLDQLQLERVSSIISKSVLEALFKKVNTRYNLSSKTTYLIHYTSLNMLLSVLQTEKKLSARKSTRHNKNGECIRMYDSLNLNDPTEGRFLAQDNLGNVGNTQFNHSGAHAYVASFIIPCQNQKDEDSLKYWLAYGDQGKGVSIKFPVDSKNRNIFQRVFYGEHKRQSVDKSIKLISLKDALNRLDKLILRQSRNYPLKIVLI